MGNRSGGAGGSGIVIVRYEGEAVGTGGTTTEGTGSADGYTLHTYTDTGNHTLDFTGLDLDERLGATLTTAITGTGNLEYAGPGRLTLTEDSDYAGTTLISGGILVLGDNGTGGSLGGGEVTNDSFLVFNRSDDIFQGTHFAAISGTGQVHQTGDGVTELTAANTYVGGTVVENGTLLVNNATGSGTGSGDVEVRSGATLGGSGTIGGDTTIEGGGTHSPGGSDNAGVLTHLGNLTYDENGGSPVTVQWELFGQSSGSGIQSGPAFTFDQIVVDGDLEFAAATTLELNFNSVGSNVDWSEDFWQLWSDKEWLVYEVSGNTEGFGNLALSDPGTWLDSHNVSFASANTGGTFFLHQSSGGNIYLRYQAVPEPAGFTLLGLALGLVTLIARPRRALSEGSATV